jgi:hypothetical protein
MDGQLGEMSHTDLGLVDYGIHNEQSHIRAHVSVANQEVYVFQTSSALEAIKRWNPPLKSATQPGCNGRPTALGWPMPYTKIPGFRRVIFYTFDWSVFAKGPKQMTTSEKGAAAVQCVLALMKKGMFPFWIEAFEDDNVDIQISGTDIVVDCKKKVQVKCDWFCGQKPKGTGNVFLQRAEINPFKFN